MPYQVVPPLHCVPIFVQDNKTKTSKGNDSIKRVLWFGMNMWFSWKSKCTTRKHVRLELSYQYRRWHLPQENCKIKELPQRSLYQGTSLYRDKFHYCWIIQTPLQEQEFGHEQSVKDSSNTSVSRFFPCSFLSPFNHYELKIQKTKDD